MNRKLIAAAVSAAVVAPVASQAEMTVYGRVNNAIDINDLAADGDSTTDISGVSSRFGLKGSTDIGNGMTVHGRYEFGTTTDKEKSSTGSVEDDAGDEIGTTSTSGGVEDVRIATVGLSGAFGRVDIGNQWSAYFNTFGTMVSPTYSLGYYLYSSVGGGPFRASNTIKYSNSFGPLTAQLDIRLNESGDVSNQAEKIRGDGVGLGLTFAVNDNISIAAAFDSEDGVDGASPSGDADRAGVAVKGSFGGIAVTLGHQSYEVEDFDGTVVDGGKTSDTDVDSTFINASGSLGEKTTWLLSYSEAEGANYHDLGDDSAVGGTGINADSIRSADDSTQLVWGIYHNLGGGLKLYYEATNVETFNADGSDNYDGARHLLGMRVDF